ncbi:GNAT family N-acetyltransferase [Bacillus sp. UNC438CL73TsuS30]|uniref:GNAT family N-acetyltransferase n=1 Tax=Bacillus sp. UNC438CL73TsuS30 TaxID=1340434 RepID=UPI00047B55E0|nr:GNAT family N-acetyltransferase [Bacillus sp. UNC438CL73TsuS30]
MEIRIEALKNKDVHLIPKLIESGMNKDIFPLTIFSSIGYEAYLKKLLTIPEEFRRVKLYGAFINDQLAGYTEWRILKNHLFLNNIYVLHEYQGLGIGRSLLVKHGYKLLDENRKSNLSLDVFDNNTKAMNWYEKIGFVKKNSTYWYVREQPFVTTSNCFNECYIENYPNAEVDQKAFGFSMLTCTTRNGVYQIGRINHQLYRLTNPKSIHDDDLLHCLYKLDSKRKLLLMESEILSSQFPATLACQSNRMDLKI